MHSSYIPTDCSGVTVATGVDLGHQSRDGLARMGVPRGVIDKCAPYMGLKTRAEVLAKGLNPRDLVLSEQEVRQLDQPFKVMFHRKSFGQKMYFVYYLIHLSNETVLTSTLETCSFFLFPDFIKIFLFLGDFLTNNFQETWAMQGN